MTTHNSPVSGEEPERPKPAPRATGRDAAVSPARRPASETPLAHHAIENRPHNDGVPWFAEAMRLVVRFFSDRNLAVTVRLDDRVFSVSASEHGEKQR